MDFPANVLFDGFIKSVRCHSYRLYFITQANDRIEIVQHVIKN